MAATRTMEAAYRSLWHAAWPLVRWYVRRKDLLRLVDSHATRERFGYSQKPSLWRTNSKTNGTSPRPWTLWIHGASVGECISALPIVELVLSPRFPIAQLRPTRVVITTTTAAARQLVRRRLEEANASARVVCIFAPLDAPWSVERFYDAWRPDAGLWVESELWPTLVLEASRRQIPIAVINARISDRSVRWWSMSVARSFIRHVVSKFSLVLCQDTTNQLRFQQLGARAPIVATNLKFASAWQASDPAQLHTLQRSLRGRVVWGAVSTHDGEEWLLAEVHTQVARLLAQTRTATEQPPLLVVIPRHLDRTAAIVKEIQQKYPSLRIALRSSDELPDITTEIFIVDTMGETGLFFDAIPTIVMGGTFVPRGGHNPIEPLRAGCHVFLGPHTHNFHDIITQLNQQPDANLLTEVATLGQLTERLTQHLLSEPRRQEATQTLMRALSVQAMTTYERKLVQWLASDKKQDDDTRL